MTIEFKNTREYRRKRIEQRSDEALMKELEEIVGTDSDKAMRFLLYAKRGNNYLKMHGMPMQRTNKFYI